ncbi:MAG: carboxypeptidase regulatory-like domain-containing protein [Symploca sp. SIO2B6]|nr:carboxypeptidase regulatory-like domain-containing protein [Symploca sp. SIO2B6]
MKRLFVSSMMLLAVVGWPLRSLAHGVVIETTPIDAFQIQALYDSGEPMAQAQITVYAPDNPEVPWLQAIANDDGYFLFTPDPSLPGDWDVQIRQAGHGEFLRIAVNHDGRSQQTEPSSQPFGHALGTPVQKWITIAAVVWGFIGTALFFSQRGAFSQRDALSQQPSFPQDQIPPQMKRHETETTMHSPDSTLNK